MSVGMKSIQGYKCGHGSSHVHKKENQPDLNIYKTLSHVS